MRVAQRLQMWQATIKPTLLYGLECLPLSSALRHEVTSFAMKHIRAITANQSHITHTSDAELLQQHKVCSISDSLLSAIRRNSTTLEQYPVSDMTEWGHRCLDAFQAACVNMTAVQRQFDPHACPICGVYFDSRRAVKVHIARAHPSQQTGPEAESSIPTPPIPLPAESAITEPVSGTASSISSSQNVSACQARVDSARFSCSATPAKQIILVHDAASTGVDGDTPADRTLLTAGTVTHGQPVVFCKATHSKNGLPTCAACHKNFGRWSGLCKHITKGYCPAMFSLKSGQAITPAPDFLPMVRRPDVIAVVLSRGLSGLNHLPALLEEMKQRCVLCHQWVASSWMMKNHFRNTHADFWQENHALCDKCCKDQGVCSLHCNYCGKYTRERGNALAHMKRCTVLWQAAVLHFALQDGGHCRSGSSGGGVLREGPGISTEADSHGRGGHTAATQRQRRAQRYKGPAQGWYRASRAWSEGPPSEHEPSLDRSRRCHPDSASGHSLCMVPQVRSSDDSARPLSCSRGMADRSGEAHTDCCRQEAPTRHAVPHDLEASEHQP